MNQISDDIAGNMLGVIESRRQHLANIIVALNGIAITLIVAIWAFLGKEFISYSSVLISSNSISNNDVIVTQEFAFSYVVLAAGLSSIVMVVPPEILSKIWLSGMFSLSE